jgi:hypothetical protein
MHGISGSFPKRVLLRSVNFRDASADEACRAKDPTVPKIYVIHENDAWVEPLRAAFSALDLPYIEWFVSEGLLDLSTSPPEGVFYNRMSASSHTRGHRYAPELTAGILAWLESHGKRVINNGSALRLEISKIAQYAALSRHGIRTPRTIAAVGRDQIISAAGKMSGSFITKHNRAGKGLGVKLFQNVDALTAHVDGPTFEDSVDGITLIQEYIRAPEPYITRVEFVGGRFLYAVRVDTTLGFELCPADVCQLDDAICPAGETLTSQATPRFQIVRDFDHPIVERYRRFIADNGIGIAGVEFITDASGEMYTYDVNTNTNYNAAAESAAGIYGMRAIAAYLGSELKKLERSKFGTQAAA